MEWGDQNVDDLPPQAVQADRLTTRDREEMSNIAN